MIISFKRQLLTALFGAALTWGRIAPEVPSVTPLLAPHEEFPAKPQSSKMSAGFPTKPPGSDLGKVRSRTAQAAWAIPPEHVGQGIQFKIHRHAANRVLGSESKDAAVSRIIETVRRVISYIAGDVTPERVFRHAGLHEARHRAYGLHLWYRFDVKLPGEKPTSEHARGQHVLAVLAELNKNSELAEALEHSEAELKIAHSSYSTNDPYLFAQTHYDSIYLQEAWDITAGRQEVVVQVVDSGIDGNHPDLQINRWVNEAADECADGVDNDGNGFVDDCFGYNHADGFGGIDLFGSGSHGTHCAGTIAADNDNAVGVAGVAGGKGGTPGVSLMTSVVFGTASSGGFAESLVYGADNGAHISSNSWGYTIPNVYESSVLDAMDYCDNSGTLIVFAAGNDGTNEYWYPAYYSAAIAVGATTDSGEAAWFTNYGDWVDISGPGYDVTSTVSVAEGSYGSYSGTSMACPHVAGVLALGKSYLFNKSNDELKACLYTSATNISMLNSNTYDGGLGAGLVNAFSYLNCLELSTVSPTLSPSTSAPTTLTANCVCDAALHLVVTTDAYPSENSYKFSSADSCSKGTLSGPDYAWASYTTYTLEISNELCRGVDYTFSFLDSWGDGICCVYGSGSYFLVLDGVKIFSSTGEFAFVEETIITPPMNTSTLSHDIAYLAFATHDATADLDNVALFESDGKISTTSWSDDVPMEHVPLQFPFLYGGERMRNIWLSPNGLLSFTPVPPCNTVFADPDACDFDSAPTQKNNVYFAGYQSLVAVFTSDFDPSASENSIIRYASSDSKFLVRWENMALYNSVDASFNFEAELRASGALRIYLNQVKDISQVSDAPYWLDEEGLLVAMRLSASQLNRTMVTLAQRQARSDWLNGLGSSGTGVDGIYIPRDSVVASNTRLDFCPVPLHFCLSPAFARLSASTPSPKVNVTLTAAAGVWGCDSDLFSVRSSFRNTSFVAFSDECFVAVVENAAPGRTTVDVDGETGSSSSDLVSRTEIVCALPDVLSTSASSYTVTLEWAPASDGSVWQEIPSSSSSNELVFIVLEATDHTASHVSPAPSFSPTMLMNMESQTALDECSSGDEVSNVCDGCGKCGGGSACLGCDDVTVFADVDCGGSCDGKNGSYVQDVYGTCCDAVHETDCRGVCGGTFLQGWSANVWACCATVDCTTTCGGTASIDSCDVCSGGTTGHVADSDLGCDGVCFSGVTCSPTQLPTMQPTVTPSLAPTDSPTLPPTSSPSEPPTMIPTPKPSLRPSIQPTGQPVPNPTVAPSLSPSPIPSWSPSTVDTTSGLVGFELDAMTKPPDSATITALKAVVYASFCNSTTGLVAPGNDCRIVDFHVSSHSTITTVRRLDDVSTTVQQQHSKVKKRLGTAIPRALAGSYVWVVSFVASAPLSAIEAEQGIVDDTATGSSVFTSAVTTILSEPSFESTTSTALGEDSLNVDTMAISIIVATRNPSLAPSPSPSSEPTNPTYSPTPHPVFVPSSLPSRNPQPAPTLRPTHLPTKEPSHLPSPDPTIDVPTHVPTHAFTPHPTGYMPTSLSAARSGVSVGFWIVIGSGFGMAVALFMVHALILSKDDPDSDDENSEMDVERFAVPQADLREAMRIAQQREARAARLTLAKSIPVTQFRKSKLAAKAKQARANHEGDDTEEVCSICIVEFEANDTVKELSCSHCYHPDCLDSWLSIKSVCPLCKSEVVPPKPTMLSRAAALVPRNITATSSRNARNATNGDNSGVELTPVAAPAPAPPSRAATRPAAPATNTNPAPTRERYQRPQSARARDVQSLMDRGYTEAVARRSLELALGDLDMAVLLAVPVSQAAQTTPEVLSSPASPSPASPEHSSSASRTSRESSEGPRSASSRLVPANQSGGGGSSDGGPSRSRSRSLSRSSVGSQSVSSSVSASSSPSPAVPNSARSSSSRNSSSRNASGDQSRGRTTPGRSGNGRGGGRGGGGGRSAATRPSPSSASSLSGRGRVTSSRARPVVDL